MINSIEMKFKGGRLNEYSGRRSAIACLFGFVESTVPFFGQF